ncbi:MAG TPA: amidohydrolase, partial [Gammaproteobacteria bacterium]
MKRLFITLLAALAMPLSGSVLAETYAITNGRILTMGPQGVIENGTVVIEDGRIVAVGENVSAPAGAEVIDAAGKVVSPGFMDPASYLGLVEIGAEEATVDVTTDSDRYTAAHAVAPAVNPRSTLIPVNRIEGITRAVTRPFPGSSIFAGSSALISLGSVHDYLLDDRVAMHITLGEDGAELTGGSRAAAIVRLREALQDARDFGTNRRA